MLQFAVRGLLRWRRVELWGTCIALGCAPQATENSASPRPSQSSPPVGSVSAGASASAMLAPAVSEARYPETPCPEDMVLVAGASFWMGTPAGRGASDEAPRFRTRVAPFCMHRTEVTVAQYQSCVSAGHCTAARTARRFCNLNFPERVDHPINCVDWEQSNAFCRHSGLRLPTEVEWEYAARGGEEQRPYPWGAEPPHESRTCWKHVGGSCSAGSVPAGAFGLSDISGNVWEWTDTWFGAYPWPPITGTAKVYRGGSWSRRFDKWMSPTLRNRYNTDHWGSHLGFRCAKTPDGTSCPYGENPSGGCLHGVEQVECGGTSAWNGARCARDGAPRCAPGRSEVPGHGCVADAGTPDVNSNADTTNQVHPTRTPEHDADCAQHHPDRPRAYRYDGGSHAERNLVGRNAGCSNRDVGVGWNSTCCP